MDNLRERLDAGLGQLYTIERELGGGGMSRVFLAEEKALARRVVIKVLPPDLGAGFNVDRFRREIKVSASLQHPHIVPLLTAGQLDSTTAEGHTLLYYTMPLVEGQSLRAKLEREGELPVPTALRILTDVLDALDYAHAHGVVHRDIKPDNVLISGQHAVVTDFGVAKALTESAGVSALTSAGLALGTAAYMAPEQAAADPHVDHRADIYAVGAMAYEMLTGGPVFAGNTAQQVLAAHVTRTPEPISQRRASLSPSVAALVMRCLEKSPADRWQSAAELKEEITRTSTPSGGSTPTVPVAATRRRPRARIVGSILLLTMAIVGWLWWKGSAPVNALDRDVVAVLPFRVTGADQSYGEGMVDLLAAKLTGEGGPRATDPQSSVSAWTQAGGQNLPRDRALEVARRLGAGKLLTGSIVGTTNQLVLTASLLDVPSRKEESRGEVTGSADSLMVLVDRLATQLLAGSSGAAGHRLDKLTSTSLAALRSYLAGQSAHRRGAYNVAIGHFRRAVESDSSFALAAIGLASSAHWVSQRNVRDSALALAERLRSRLSVRDAAFLDMKKAMASFPERLPDGAWTDAALRMVTLAPESAEGWYDLGDSYFHNWSLLEIANLDGRSRAREAFQRAAALDSGFAAPLEHMIEMTAASGDTGELRALARRYFQIDSTGDLADFMRWRVAAGLNDEATLAAVRARFRDMNENSLMRIAGTAILDGVEVADAESALAMLRQHATSSDRQIGYHWSQIDLMINLGKPRAAAPHYDQVRQLEPIGGILSPIWDAIYGDGDISLAEARAREAVSRLVEPIPPGRGKRQEQFGLTCTLIAWQTARGDTAGMRVLVNRLDRLSQLPETADGGRACLLLVRASRAIDQATPEARQLVQQLDTMPWIVQRLRDPVTIMMMARLRELTGDTTAALRLLRKRPYHWAETWFLAPRLREEGRLAALTGDRQGAIRAYQHFLRLRAGAEPQLQPQVQQVREELAKLVGEQ